jgi:arsenate reductase
MCAKKIAPVSVRFTSEEKGRVAQSAAARGITLSEHVRRETLRTGVPNIIYGIRKCDKMKRARAWLDSRGVIYAFHDYKAVGIERTKLEGWIKEVGWEALLNQSSTTFRNLPDADKASLTEENVIALMLARPSVIKRPVLEFGGGKLVVGFSPDSYQMAFGKSH